MSEKNLLVADHRGDGLEAHLRPLEQAGYRLHVTHSLRETAGALGAGEFELVIAAPLVSDGRVELETLDRLRAARGTPVMVVSCTAGPGPTIAAAAALQHGPWDLIHGGASAEEVLMRIARLGRDAAHYDELEELRWRANHDERTGLLRPDSFAERLSEHFSATQRHRMDMALVMIDLDCFGVINKEFDHTIGDAVIASVGNVIRGQRRAEDVAARLGGDEFALILPYTRRVEAAHVMRRMCREIRALSHFAPPEYSAPDGGPRRVEVSASMGFETFDGTDIEDACELRRHAEIALRSAKRRRGNQAVYYRLLGDAAPEGEPLCPSA